MTDDLIPLTTTAAGKTPAKPRRRRRRRWGVRFAVFFVLLLAVVWFAPKLVARTGLLNYAVAKGTADLKGTARVGGASLGWLSPVEVRDVTVTDATGRTLAAVPKATTSKSLLGFVLNQTDLGTVTVEKPTVEIVCENGSTNLEDAIANYLKPSDKPSGDRPALTLKVTDASVTIRDGEKVRTLTDTTADVTIPRAAADPISVKVNGKSGTGTLDADLVVGDTIGGKLVATDFPLDLAEPFARRGDPTLTLAGKLTADATGSVTLKDGALASATASGVIKTLDLSVTSPHLGPDPVRLSRVELPLAVRTEGSIVRIEKLDLTTDFGSASVGGTIDTSKPVEKLLDQTGLKASADVDVAKLAAVAPKLLRLRDGLSIQEGRIAANIESVAGPTAANWKGSVRTSAVKATRLGKAIVWPKPLEASFVGHVGPKHLPVFDQLDVTADFATITARGSAERFGAAGTVNLDELTARLGEFVDLGSLRLAGTAKLDVKVQPTTAGTTAADGEIKLTNLRLADGPRELREPELVLKITANGVPDAYALVAANVTIVAGDDKLSAQLLDPIPDLNKLASGRATAGITGDLARWRSRLSPFVSIPTDWNLAGTGNVTAGVRFDADAVRITDAKGDLNNLRFTGAGLNVDESRVELHPTAATYTRSTGKVDVGELQFASQTLGFAAKSFTLTPTPAGYDINCDVLAHVNLARLQRVLNLQTDPKLGDALGGMVESGSIKLSTAGGKYRFALNAPVKKFTYGPPTKPTWEEPSLSLVGEGEYDLAGDTLTLTAVKAERPSGLSVDAKGTIAKLSGDANVDVTGKLAYDLATLEPQLKEFLGKSVKVTGKDTRDFKLAGSLAAGPGNLTATVGKESATQYANLSGNAAVGWESVKAYGFDVGKADLKANLEKGVISIDPVEASFGQTGKVRLQPTVKLLPTGTELQFAPGNVVTKATLTPAACADALGYALPPLAKSSECEGTVSLELGENRIPLSDPEKAHIVGRLTLHNVRVGPGPVVTELCGLLGAKVGKITLANEQVVPVQVKDGQVYHHKLPVTVNGYTITTSGSVGMDGTMNVLAEVPVPESAVGSLLKNNPKIRELVVNKRINVIVTGTVDRPKLDRGAFAAAVRQFVADVTKEAAGGIGRDLLKKEIDKILPKKE